MSGAFSRKQIRIFLISILLLCLAYYGVPVGFLKSPVQRHLEDKYGLHIELGSVRVSARGLVVTDVSAVWPTRQTTLAVEELMLGFSPIKSLIRRKAVFERLKIIYPTFTLRLPDMESPAVLASPAAAGSPVPPMEGLRLPPSFDLTIRRGKIHLMRGVRSIVIHPFDAEIERPEPGRITAWLKLDSLELGNLEVAFEEGKTLNLEAEGIGLSALTEITGSPQKLSGRLFARARRDGDRVGGEISLEGLTWTGSDRQVVEAPPEVESSVETAAETETPGETEPPEMPAADTAVEVVQVPSEEIPFIFPALDIRLTCAGRWQSPLVQVEDAQLSVGGVTVKASGTIERTRMMNADLDFYVPVFDEPALERLSGHFHVLRYLHNFLRTIESPSQLQAKMKLKGPLVRPADWKYEGLVDIQRDTFSYDPFLGQYSFLGTVEFNEHGVRIPEILMPFGPVNLVLSGTAADYATSTARLELKGKDLTIGPMIQYYVPAGLKPEDTSADVDPGGFADVDLVLTRYGSMWGLNGAVDFKRLSIPLRNVATPVRAYGRVNFSGRYAEGSLLMRLGTFETALNPFIQRLFTDEVEYGIALKQPEIRWDRLSKALTTDRPIPYLPVSGRGSASVKWSSLSAEPPDPQTPEPRRWRAEGTIDLSDGRVPLPVFVSPVDSVTARLVFETDFIRFESARGVLAHTPLWAEGRSAPGNLRSWSLNLRTADLDLASLLKNIRGRTHTDAPPKPFEISAEVTADRLKFHAFEIPAVSGRFTIRPGQFKLHVDTPIVTDYLALSDGDRPWSEITFSTPDTYPLKNLFVPQASIAGEISGTVVMKGRNLTDSEEISGYMDLALNRLTLKRAPPMLQVLDLMRLSLTDAVVFNPIHYISPIDRGAVLINLDQSSNVGRWLIRGKLGLDAGYMPLTEQSDSAFHVTFYPRENIVTRILQESKILEFLGGKREGIKLDFYLVGNYNNSNILWIEEPFVSVIRGRVSELVPGFFAAPAQPDTSPRPPSKGDRPRGDPAPAPSP